MGYLRQRSTRGRVTVAVIATSMALGAGAASAQTTGVAIDPAVNDFTLAEGETWSEELTITVPADTSTPEVDVYILADTTGSMGLPIDAVIDGANVIIDDLIAAVPDSDVRFGVGDFKDFPNDEHAFHNEVSLTDDTAAVQAGLGTWSATGGGDGAEGQFYAYDQIAEDRAPSNDGSSAGTIGWRPDAEKLLVVFADAPAHDPVCSAVTETIDGHELGYDITEASVTSKLASAGITFVGVSTQSGFAGGMDDEPGTAGDYGTACGTETTGTAGQATRIADATGGAHQTGIDNDAIVGVIADEVLNAARTISNLRVEATGDTAPFVSAIDPADGFGPIDTDESSEFTVTVDWEGAVAATGVDQEFTGSLDVVADDRTVTSKDVTITVDGDTSVDAGGDDADDDEDDDTPDEAPAAEAITAEPTFTG